MTKLLKASGYCRLGSEDRFLLFKSRELLAIAVSMVLVTTGGVQALFSGSHTTSFGDVLNWVGGTHQDRVLDLILGELRLPRILLAALAGAMLGMAGAAMQSVTRNSLADPGLIGVKEGTVVAVLTLMIFAPHVDPAWRPFIGLAGGAAVALIVVLLARSLSGMRFILIGIGMSWLLASGISLFMTMGEISEVQTAMIWLGGSLHAASWLDIKLALPWAAAGFMLLLLTARAADIAMLGSLSTISLGVRYQMLGGARLLAPVLLTSACASVVGGLGFVGLIAPHLARLCIGARQVPLLLGSALLGAVLVLIADTAGRALFAPVQIPAGIVLAIVGVPFFLFVLWQRRHTL